MNQGYSIEEIIDANQMLERWLYKVLNKVIDKIYGWDIDESNMESFKKFSRQFTSLYYLMKDKFNWIERGTGERYFEHLREVVTNVLGLPNPNTDKVLIAIAHDSIEDTNKTYEGLAEDYGHEIALAVQAISKEPASNYFPSDIALTPEVEKQAKQARNKVYFSHMESFDSMRAHIQSIADSKCKFISESDLDTITQNTIDVKLADRIHNLETQWDPNKIDWVQRKIDETKQYFLPLAKEVNQVAYKSLNRLVLALEMQVHNASWKASNIITV